MPTNISYQDKLYNKLLSSIDGIYQEQVVINKEKDLLLHYSKFLTDKTPEISKFKNITLGLHKWLNEYDFNRGFNFGFKQNELETLSPLRLKLVRMGEEAMKLSVYPDRYNSKKSIETCKMLTITCMDRLLLSEVPKISQLVESNIRKLIEIQNLFKRDDDLLKHIQAEIDSNKSIIINLKAYYAELMDYVSKFPHIGEDDLGIVRERISVAKDILNLKNKVDKEVNQIRGYVDRYNKNAIVAKYDAVVRTMSLSMKYSDVVSIKQQLNDILNQVRIIFNSFANEPTQLNDIKVKLQTSSSLWKDDREDILATISRLLNTNTKLLTFSMDELKRRINIATQRRYNDIQKIKHTYPWIENADKYCTIHNTLISKDIRSTEYFSTIERLVRYRSIKRILLCIPIIGWIILMFREDFTI